MDKQRTVILADNQDITRAGIECLLGNIFVIRAADKSELITQLEDVPDAVVVLDYSLFDFQSVEEFLIICHRFEQCRWVLFSDELSIRFLRQSVYSSHYVSVVLKVCELHEIRQALDNALELSEPYICSQIRVLLATETEKSLSEITLTVTEREILKLIAQGKTTKEIAADRFLSTHTVMTHRKNIFRKLDINTIHEATKYAVRIGLVDLAEYYI